MELVISNVSKQYRGDVWGLRDFSLRLGPGIVGLLGPNGAGKSTVMRIIATITRRLSQPERGGVFELPGGGEGIRSGAGSPPH
jgi:ABC-2 type transport system ATP-binding protein